MTACSKGRGSFDVLSWLTFIDDYEKRSSSSDEQRSHTPCPAYNLCEDQLDDTQGTHHTMDTSCRFLEDCYTHQG